MGRPYVIIYVTMSIDGRIGVSGRRVLLSRKCDLERLHGLRSVVDAVLVGANTVINDNPRLTVRLKDYSGRQPYRVVVDSKLRSPVDAEVFNTSIAPTILFTSRTSSSYKKDILRGKGVEIVELDGEWFSFNDILGILYRKYGIKKILVEGGGRVISALLMEGVYDEFIVVVSPTILGRSIDLFQYKLEKPLKLRLEGISLCRCGEEVILRYKNIG